MSRRLRGMVRRGIAAAALLLATLPALAARDIVLVLDNSGSMRANDPARLAAPAVMEFIRGQPPDTRVAIVLFTADAQLALPLTPAEVAADGEAENALRKFNYRGAWTQIAAGVERGLYELRNDGRPEATRAVVLMTDGVIDTGDAVHDKELDQWLRQDLAGQARNDGVYIFGVAFTERADYQLLQSLAATTRGEYFRVLNPEGIGRALRRIDSVLSEATPAPEAPAPVATAPPPVAEGKPAAQPEAAAPASTEEGDGRWWWWALSAVALLAIAVALGWAFRLARHTASHGRAHGGEAAEDVKHDHGPVAVLFNNFERHELGSQPVVIGRAGGTDPDRQYIIVPEKTVGRWHATIERRGQTFWVRDEGSVNGTFINDERVIGEQPLKHRDTLRVHTHKYEFEIPELADADRTMLSPKPRLSS